MCFEIKFDKFSSVVIDSLGGGGIAGGQGYLSS
jgi:hypothetical protein